MKKISDTTERSGSIVSISDLRNGRQIALNTDVAARKLCQNQFGQAAHVARISLQFPQFRREELLFNQEVEKMKVGILKEIKVEENRVAMTPAGVEIMRGKWT